MEAADWDAVFTQGGAEKRRYEKESKVHSTAHITHCQSLRMLYVRIELSSSTRGMQDVEAGSECSDDFIAQRGLH
eukprot:3894451-Pleurochrysis_carterae.AAC.1